MDPSEQTNNSKMQQRVADLWHYANAVYAREGVARACLRAQDELGADVNLLLYAAWCAQLGQSLSAADFAAAEQRCNVWRDTVVRPLRAQRRRWRGAVERASEYSAIKQLELAAERAQLEMLAGLLTPAGELSMPAGGLSPPTGEFSLDAGMSSARDPSETADRLHASLVALAAHYALAAAAFRDFETALNASQG